MNVINIREHTLKNTLYRRVLTTTTNLQLVAMSIPPLGGIPLEIHRKNDQLFRVERGRMKIGVVSKTNSRLVVYHTLKRGDVFIVPKGTYHVVTNPSRTVPLKMYTLYSPPHHPRNLRQIHQ